MIKITASPENNKIIVQINNIAKASKEGIRKAFYFIGKDLVQTGNELILDQDKNGELYVKRLGGRLVRHRASSPGQPPANFTGNLRKSLGFDVRGSEQLEFGSRSGPPAAGVSPKQNVADYAKDLEVGSSKVEARPYLKPSVKLNERNSYTHFETQLKREITK
jgi:hypothetical protein